MTRPVFKQLAWLQLLTACLFFAPQALSDTIKVAVAANFKSTLTALKPIFEKQSGHNVIIITSGTGHLSNQILNGAPFDVFLAANESHPKNVFKQLQDQRQLSPQALTTYAHGRLALLGRQTLPEQPIKQILSGSAFSKIALANAKLAPYGLAAQQTLKYLKLSKHWQGRLVRGQNVAQVYQFVHTKNVDAGFVAYSMVQHLPKAQFIEVPAQYYQKIKQMALRLNHKKVSMDFMNFLSGDNARTTILQQGYNLPPLQVNH